MTEATPTASLSATSNTNADLETPHFESCLCPIYPFLTPLPLDSRTPDPSDPILPGQCIYHHRLSTREAESAIFVQLAPEIDELKEVLSSGMVKFKHSSGAGQVVLKKATSEELDEASTGLKTLIAEREGLVQGCWALFVGRWGGRVERRDDGTMFVVDAGKVLEEEVEEEEEEVEAEDSETEEAGAVGKGEGDGKGKEGEEGEKGEKGEPKAKPKGKSKAKAKAKTKAQLDESVQDDEADPYVKRMREVQARMDDLEVGAERKEEKRAKAAVDE